MNFEIEFPEDIEAGKRDLRFSIAVEPELKEELDRLPTKYKTNNVYKFLKKLVSEYRKKNKAS